ncbi:lipopolysaccharide kinase InaA family protein [Aliarcobacter skirrowii]|uniref:lipopolysaccharide kinase InaA family protein n=1 Tax=Aliarcobacter skirrowii TaxID=28200 RepID=UPI0029BA64D7|nr:lipopolysaccharide kinase InaA family protein [Aliarcobacter skirrowii]MDX4039920.1 lipopolysaccharide kinase InaA family protein [Aliarcobacter skirrowii]MDY0181567.1 lipopolysaccharide kinase InaA family protein [Aliarcobacter skirrowii]
MSKFKLEVNEEFKTLKNFVKNIKIFFQKNNNTIHKARNEIKVINYENRDFVVKSFKIPHIINKFVYTFFKSSKAKKSYDYALKIENFTPKPIGYIEFYENFLINDSYFISEKFDYDFTIREPLLDINFPNKNEIFKAFAQFTFDLHENGIYHLDYSPGNILIKKENDNFIFKIVDINRMKFLNMDLEKRAKNFSKLWAKDEDLEFIAKEYAKIYKTNNEEFISKTISFSRKHKAVKNFKKRLKGIKVVD